VVGRAVVVVFAAVMTAPTAGGEVIGVVVPPLFVDVVRLGAVCRLATAGAVVGHANTRSQQPRQSVTVSPGRYNSVSGLSEVFRNVSESSPMNGGA
jgi:hypothetical protein